MRVRIIKHDDEKYVGRTGKLWDTDYAETPDGKKYKVYVFDLDPITDEEKEARSNFGMGVQCVCRYGDFERIDMVTLSDVRQVTERTVLWLKEAGTVEFKTRLREKMREQKITVREFCAAAGCSTSHFYSFMAEGYGEIPVRAWLHAKSLLGEKVPE